MSLKRAQRAQYNSNRRTRLTHALAGDKEKAAGSYAKARQPARCRCRRHFFIFWSPIFPIQTKAGCYGIRQ
jgi:hypothetical protein